MVIGNGIIAKAFSSYNENSNVIIYASGVSNSKETSPKKYERERKLLNNTILQCNKKTLVYFSTCSITDKSLQQSEYVSHKIAMEKLITNNCKSYYIFRLPQVVGRTNSPTLVNFIAKAIKNEEPFVVQKNATRN